MIGEGAIQMNHRRSASGLQPLGRKGALPKAFGSIAGAGFNKYSAGMNWSWERDTFYSIVQI
jgi:hypothetical protein